MAKQPNPLPKDEKIAKRLEPDITTDAYSPEEQEKIITMIEKDIEADKQVLAQWKIDRALDLKHYYGEKPSILENLDKKEWQSDRNLGLCQAICDSYQATLLATCINKDSLRAVPTSENDIDNQDNYSTFAKWTMRKDELDFLTEGDDYIHNKITQGVAYFDIYWKVWYEWVDHHIPKKDGGYRIETKKDRFEKGVIENISNVDDILLPKYGKKIQDLPHIIRIIHKYVHEILDNSKRKIYTNVNRETINKFKMVVLNKMKENEIDDAKKEALGLTDVTDEDVKSYPIDLYKWQGIYTKNGKTEKYQFIIEPITRTFLAGKPLRKIRRDGKYTIVGGPFSKVVGQIPGRSLPRIIMHPINAFNNTWNQKSDFQYVENCPFGFYKPDENYQEQEYNLEPGVLYPSDDPQNINIPNFSRSMAWAYNDIRLLFEVIEKITGAASYFQTSERKVSGTATRDILVAQHSQTRFGIWVTRIQSEFCEALNMVMKLYQDVAPPSLAKRVLGEDGKRIFPKLSVKDLRGNYDLVMSPDITGGSRVYDAQMKAQGLAMLQNSIWVDPRINPKGNYNLYADTMKAQGFLDVERYLGPEPKAEVGSAKEIQDEWARFMQGEEVELIPGENPMEHLAGHEKQRAEKYYELPEAYRENFDKHLFATRLQFVRFVRQMRQQEMADRLAQRMLMEKEVGISEEAEEIARERGARREARPTV